MVPPMTPPILTDRKALATHRARAHDLFLHHEAVAEVQDRLSEVNRTFTAPVVVTPFPEVWRDVFAGARLIGDDEVLAVEPGAHDLAIHALCLHWANDPVGQLVQLRRALRPDGMALVLMFGGQTLNELRAVLAQAEAEVTGGLSPRVLPMGEIRDLGGLLQRAGFALPVADSYARRLMYRNAIHLMHDLRAMGEGNALAARLRRPTRRTVLARAAELYRQTFAQGDLVPATFETVALTGWVAHESQQKPLKPGSAVQRLADALGADDPLPSSRDNPRDGGG